MKRAIALFLILGCGVYADKYDRLEAYYEKRSKLEDSTPCSHHFNLKHDLFFDTLSTDHTSIKGQGRGWRGNYEYLTAHNPYFSLEGAYSSTDRMDWDGVAVDSVRHSLKDKMKGVEEIHLRDQGSEGANYRLFQSILRSGGSAAFVFNGSRYYCKDLIEHPDHIDRVNHGDILDLNNDWMTGGHVETDKIGSHLGRNIAKRQGNSIRFIRYNGKKYYRIKDRLEEKEVLRSSLGSVSKTLADINMKVGTTRPFGKALVTPFAGIGYHSVRTVEDLKFFEDHEREIVDRHPELRVAGINDTYYASWGAKCKYVFSPWFDVGLNGQINHGLLYDASGFAPQHDKGLFSMVGYRASMPVSLHLGTGVKYNLEGEPYIDQFNVGRKEVNTGIRFSTGVSF